MEEVRDQQKIFAIGIQIQRIMLVPDPGVQFHLYKAWEESSNYEDGHEWYHVELENNVHWLLRGLLDATRGILYLDAQSTLALVQDRIDRALSTFNAGHWPYKGL